MERLRPSIGPFEEGSRFCLEDVHDLDTEDNPNLARKQSDLLRGVEGYEEDDEEGICKCNIGGCDRKINRETGEKVGVCKALSYCLKKKFKAVGATPTAAGGQALYREIIDTCDGAADSHNSGHFCPRLPCGLSAGVSIDQVPGTHDECIAENQT